MHRTTIPSYLIVFSIITLHMTQRAAAAPNAATTQPLFFPISNESFNHAERSAPGFKVGMDPADTLSGKPALLLMGEQTAPTADGSALARIDVKPFLGRQIRFTAMVKSEGLANWGGIGLAAIGPTGKWERFDTMSNQLLAGEPNRPIHGTTDWSSVEIVTDLPANVAQLMIGLQMKGAGRLWIDSATIEIVPDKTPTTDDRNPHLYSDYSPNYSLALDKQTLRDGHPTVCVTPNHPPHGAHAWFGLVDRAADQYLGHKIRLSAWMKCEGHGSAHLSLVAAMPVRGPDPEIDNEAGQRAFPLTRNWQHYEVVGTLPANAQCLTEGDFLFGAAKFWIDDMKVEIDDAKKN
jgi:hypothetical protein